MAEQITKINLDLNKIDAQTVTNLYLYGTTGTPLNKQRVTQNTIQVNVDSAKYMQEGAGRYAKASEVQFVQDFFAGQNTFNGKQLQNGTYTKSQLISQLGLNHDQAVSTFNFSQYQYAIDPNNSDYANRVYIWNTTGYTVSQDTEFVINGNQRYIRNLKVLAFQDNFDFIGGSPLTNAGNYYLKTNIDPTNIGKKVNFVFNNKENVNTQYIYGLSDFNFDKNFIKNTPTGNILNAIFPMRDIVNQLTSTNTFTKNDLYLSHNFSGTDLSVSFKSINHAYNSFSSLSSFESTSKIGDFSLSGSNLIYGFPTTNNAVKNITPIIGQSSNHVSPLTFDLDGDGIETNHIYSQNVYFDIDADGFAEKIGWIKADDGQLAFDANKNGKIDDITELFGDDKQPAFDKLKTFDSNKNGKIDAGDAKFGELLVWRDLSQDGKTNSGELKTLTETGIKEIGLNEVKETTYQNENYISGRAKYTLTNGTQRDIADVHFLNDNINTWFQGAQSQEFGNNFKIDPTTLLMPLSRGYGSLPSLHIAITQNATLKTMMLDIMNLKPKDFGLLAGKMQDFLLEWAGVRGNNPNALDPAGGSYIDSRQVNFIEKFTGITWKQRGTAGFTAPDASIGLKKTWSHIMDMMTSRILVQGPLRAVFANAQYDFVTDKMTLGDNFTNLVAKSKSFAGTDATTAHDYWLALGNIFTSHKADLGVSTSAVASAINSAYGKTSYINEITTSGLLQSQSGEILGNSAYQSTNGANNVMGSNFNDYIYGDIGSNTISGRYGDDYRTHLRINCVKI